MTFPQEFIWGAATSAYQIEGAATDDGRGLSVWDEFCTRPGKTHAGDTGAVACDHYHRFPDDIALMGQMGLRAYRFSVSWPRVIPAGRGPVNSAGLSFYDRLVDQLLQADIQPWLTLFHWDYPLALYREGGWLNPESPRWFADYVQVIVHKLSDRVAHWITLNEPQCFIGLGHHTGIHAPGVQLPLTEVLHAAHHVLLAHGLAVQTIRAAAKLPPKIGWSPAGDIAVPATNRPDDVAAAREAHWSVAKDSVWNLAWWYDPVLCGRYPDNGLRAYGAAVPKFTDGEMEIIRQPLDFLGLNIYNGYSCRRGAAGEVETAPRLPGGAQTHNLWHVTPSALHWGPYFAYERYGLPIVITENGMAGHDWVSLDGHVHDPQRIDYLTRYLGELRSAMRDGVPVTGYFAWSLLDNFEWAEGYRYRFGLIHVDYATQKRTLKDSAKWYRDLIRARGAINHHANGAGSPEPAVADMKAAVN